MLVLFKSNRGDITERWLEKKDLKEVGELALEKAGSWEFPEAIRTSGKPVISQGLSTAEWEPGRGGTEDTGVEVDCLSWFNSVKTNSLAN